MRPIRDFDPYLGGIAFSWNDWLGTDRTKRRFRASPLPTCCDGRMPAIQLALPALFLVIACGLGKTYHLAAFEHWFGIAHGAFSLRN